jgi:beta-glucanase (GH16 family)
MYHKNLLIGGSLFTAFLCFFSVQVSAQWILQPQYSDEFDYAAGTTIDMSKWFLQTNIHVNNEAQQYVDWQYNVPAASHLTDYVFRTTGATIQIVARNQTYNGYNYISGRLNSQCRMAFTYGRIEFRIKPPAATVSGLWPAVWMLGNNICEAPGCASAGTCTGWPNCGENDMWEYQSSKQGTYITNGYPEDGSCGQIGNNHDMAPGNQAGVWRIYSCQWDANNVQYWYRNDGQDSTVHSGAFSKTTGGCGAFRANMFYLLNVAVGGTLGNPINCSFPQTMEVDYIRCYKLRGDPQVSIIPSENMPVPALKPTIFSYCQSKFRITVDKATHTRISISDLAGRLVQVKYDGDLAAGTHEFAWDKRASSGAFIVTVRSGEKTDYFKAARY